MMIDTTRNMFRSDAPADMLAKWKEEYRGYLTARYGEDRFDGKFDRWLSFPKPVLSVVHEHTELLEDIEKAYVGGALYSALTGACCLGERIFNQIIINIRDDYRAHLQYKQVYRKGSINDWDLGIDTLKAWDVLETGTEKKYRRLAKIRNDSVHFQPKQQDLNAMAKESIELVNGIIDDIFGIRPGNKYVSWCEVPGEMYLRKEYETTPFVKAFYIPAAKYVGYKHTLESTPERTYRVVDDYPYPETDVSDEEFVRLRKEENAKTKQGF